MPALKTREGDIDAAGSGLAAEELIQCEKAQGLVPARNTVDVRLVLRPPRRETFEFAVHCALRPSVIGG